MLRGADAGDDILALGIDQVLAIKLVGAGRGVAREGHAGRAIRPHIAEHHRLDVHRRAPVGGNVVQPPVGDGARVHPRAKDGADRAPKLLVRILRKRASELLGHQILEPGDESPPVVRGKIGVEQGTTVELVVFEQLLEMVLDAEHHLSVHLDESGDSCHRRSVRRRSCALALRPPGR